MKTIALVLLLLTSIVHAAMPRIPSGVGYDIPCGSCVEPKDISSRVVIVRQGEPGERLVIRGRILQADRVTPASGITLWLSHADASGRYHVDGDRENPRLQGWVRSDAQGRYEIDTIRPGTNPERDKQPIKIYVHLYGPRLAERFIPEFRFDDDPLLYRAELEMRSLGRLSPVLTLHRGGDGVWRGERDIVVELSQAEMIRRIMELARLKPLEPSAVASVLRCRVGLPQRIHQYRMEYPLRRCPGIAEGLIIVGGKRRTTTVVLAIADWMEITRSDFDALVDRFPIGLSDLNSPHPPLDGSEARFVVSYDFAVPAGTLALVNSELPEKKGAPERDPYDRITRVVLDDQVSPALKSAPSLRKMRESMAR